ncbi:helix-turn-helix domain containing protein [Streptomyces sp. WMMC500]|uniref:TetR/AcrR family transcriptional regulator n=1 Tax=Streptomyces sp. WMMC500 TaxID=3015154 RepID=UPI00248C425F|nr:TetR/AcrR family transcriptional regulator [Streptomyces sp. WMMC500]WBB58777.1 helix-turn-helix domain containing protein [Streptomyces sp. WMMC500]
MGTGKGATLGERQPRMRADASRNRERIIDAAREAFVEWGPEVPLDEIARRAGVGNATVYRHFADRRELILQVTMESMRRIASLAEAGLAEDAAPFEALRRFVHEGADERMGSLCSLLNEGIDVTAAEVTETRLRLDTALENLMARARAEGTLRADVGIGDLMVALAQLTRPLPGLACSVRFDTYMHRHLDLFLDGLMAPARSTLSGTAATFEDLRQRGT